MESLNIRDIKRIKIHKIVGKYRIVGYGRISIDFTEYADIIVIETGLITTIKGLKETIEIEPRGFNEIDVLKEVDSKNGVKTVYLRGISR